MFRNEVLKCNEIECKVNANKSYTFVIKLQTGHISTVSLLAWRKCYRCVIRDWGLQILVFSQPWQPPVNHALLPFL